jgi:hypothetical protein
MLTTIAHNGYFIYEASCLLLAAGLAVFALAARRINQALHQPGFWLGPLLAAVLFLLCAFIHPYVQLYLSPRYLAAPESNLLLLMYQLKLASMALVLLAGAILIWTMGAQWRAMRMPRPSRPAAPSPEPQ